MMQLAFYIDQTRCIGCYTCVVACKDWNDIPDGPANWRRLVSIEQGVYPHPFWAFLPVNCWHCAEPTCVLACPEGAIIKRNDDGIVTVDQAACLGRDECGLCLEMCPYQAPQFGVEENAKMQKCDFCLERWYGGKSPVCVAACPTRALDAGSIDELRSKYSPGLEASGFEHVAHLRPSVVFKAKIRA